MSTEIFTVGELVNVAIQGAKVAVVDDRGMVLDLGDADVTLPRLTAGASARVARIAVERQAPVEWPPMSGDLWRDRHGSNWFAFIQRDSDGRGMLRMIPEDPTRYTSSFTPADMLTRNGPVTLIQRKATEGEPQDGEL